jgi:hypothetical protein
MKWHLSHGAYAEMMRRRREVTIDPCANPLLGGRSQFAGMAIEPSNLFPMRLACTACEGTGQGGDLSTYCQRCAGAGASMVDGAMIDHHGFQMQLITRKLPKAFAVAFPSAVLVPPPPMRGRIKEVRFP